MNLRAMIGSDRDFECGIERNEILVHLAGGDRVSASMKWTLKPGPVSKRGPICAARQSRSSENEADPKEARGRIQGEGGAVSSGRPTDGAGAGGEVRGSAVADIRVKKAVV